MLGLIWRHAFDTACRRPVQEKDGHGYRFPPERAMQVLGLQHGARHAHDSLVSTLHDPILLRRIRGRELPLDAALGAVLPELDGGEFSTAIGVQKLEAPTGLHLGGSLEALDGGRRLILRAKK